MPALPRSARDCLEGLSPALIWDEISRVIKGCGLSTLQQYGAFNREGRGFALKQRAREAVWLAHELMAKLQRERELWQWQDIPGLALARLEADPCFQPYRTVVVDEGQDFSPVMLRLARRLAGGQDGQLIILADPAQNIYESGFVWAQRELRPAGGSVRWLRRNYRNTAEVYALARSIIQGCSGLEEELAEIRLPERSGAQPVVIVAENAAEEVEEVCTRVAAEIKSCPSQHIALLCPTWDGLKRFKQRLVELNVPVAQVSRKQPRMKLNEPSVKLMTVASAKGLDFPIVYIVRLTKAAFGGPARANDASTRRQLYMALTRASDKLTISTVWANHHPLLEGLDATCYEVAGSCGQRFRNVHGDGLRPL